ncbi:MAG: hypothetical protein JW849_09700 [Phycisphaerae bacterium]|nr:hypothetical protein [Phycisphaerae bacterium]
MRTENEQSGMWWFHREKESQDRCDQAGMKNFLDALDDLGSDDLYTPLEVFRPVSQMGYTL